MIKLLMPLLPEVLEQQVSAGEDNSPKAPQTPLKPNP
jgi:hypothetical protein